MNEKQLKDFYNSINKHLSFLDTVSLNASGDSTVKLITQTINKYANSEFIKNCVAVINEIAVNDYDFCKKLFEISCRLVKYRRDPEGHEIVFTPKLLIQIGQGDCKKFTVFICCCLKCKGIYSADKVVNYEQGNGWQHIYAIAFYPNQKGYLTIDPVNKQQWDTEVKYREARINFYDGTYSKIIMSKLSMMGNLPNEKFLGIGEASDEILGDIEELSGRPRHRIITRPVMQEVEDNYIEGVYDHISGDDSDISGLDEIGKKQKAATKQKRAAKKVVRQAKRKKVFKGAKKVGFAPTRAAFISLILLGKALEKTPLKFNLGKKLAEAWMKDGGVALKAMWAKFGGKPDALKNAIIKASKVQISGEYGSFSMGMGAGGGAAVTVAAITAAAPILGVTIKILHEKNVMKKQEAAEAASKVEDVEDKTLEQGGGGGGGSDAVTNTLLKEGGKLLEDALKLDDGGDKAAQDAIKKTPTKEDSTPSSSSSSDSSSSDSPPPPKKEGEPDEEKKDTAAAGFSLTNASSWITGSLTTPIMAATFHNPNAETIGAIISSVLFLGGIILIVKSILK